MLLYLICALGLAACCYYNEESNALGLAACSYYNDENEIHIFLLKKSGPYKVKKKKTSCVYIFF